MDQLKRDQLKNKIQFKIDDIVNKKFNSKGQYLSYRDEIIEDIVKLCYGEDQK